MSIRAHQAFLCSCDATRRWTGNCYNYLHSCSACTRQNQNRGITSVSRRAFGKIEGSPTNKVSCLETCTIYFSMLIYLKLKRILSPLNMTDIDPSDTKNIFADAYPAVYQSLYEGKPITCTVTGTTFDAVPAPCAVILDVSLPLYYDSKTIRW